MTATIRKYEQFSVDPNESTRIIATRIGGWLSSNQRYMVEALVTAEVGTQRRLVLGTINETGTRYGFAPQQIKTTLSAEVLRSIGDLVEHLEGLAEQDEEDEL